MKNNGEYMNAFQIIKDKVCIIDLVGRYVSLKKVGRYWKGLCPFEKEKKGNFTITPEKQIFYCFTCHIHGDVINFVEKIEDCTTRKSLEKLSLLYGLTLPSKEINNEQ